jgi:hypothetical protein
LAWKAAISGETNAWGRSLMLANKEHISKVELCLRESLKVFGYDITQDGGLKDLYQAVQANEKLQNFLEGIGLKNSVQGSINDDSSKNESPLKASTTKKNSALP